MMRPDIDTSPAPSPASPGAGEVDALGAIIGELALAPSIEAIMNACARAGRRMLRADGVSFVLREGELCHYAEEDAIAPLWKGRRFPMSACISGWVMRERQAAVVPDVARDPRIPQDAYRATFVRSLAMVPVGRDDPVAALGVYWSTPHVVARDRLALLQTIANAAALALGKIDVEGERENARQARMELEHRLKNALAIVHAVAHQTIRRAASLDEFAESFTGRLQALAAAQTLVSRSGSAGADLRTLIRDQLGHGDGDPRAALRGPEVHLPADEAFHAGLAFHELSTNARRHGALSQAGGTVAVDWELRGGGDGQQVAIDWVERGGPPVTAPARQGFGTTLLAHVFSGNGSVEMRYEPEGLVCAITIGLN